MGGGWNLRSTLQFLESSRKIQKQIVIKHKTKIHTEAQYFALKSGPEQY